MTERSITSNIVPPVGPLDAKLCFIGEAPGEEEDRRGEPFVGSAGQLLNRSFHQAGIIRSSVLITNVFLQRPPGNNLDAYYQDKHKKKLTWEGQEHIDQLRKWLTGLLKRREEGKGGPNVLVALGAEPMKILTGRKRITKWRGSVLPCTLVPGFKVYCCYHPSYVNRLINEQREALLGERKKLSQNVLPLFLIDLDRVKQQAMSKDFELPKRRFEVDLSFQELLDRLRLMRKEKPEYLAVDIETLPGPDGPVVWCIGFSPHPSWAFVVPILRRQTFAWTLEEEAQLWLEISEIFLDEDIIKITQGGTYDLSILGKYYGLRLAKGTWGDTMFCHHASYPYIKKGLEVLCSIYTWEPYYKDEGKINLGRRTDESEFRYNAKDCCVTREIYPETLKNARELDTLEGYSRSMSILPSHLGMMIRGIKFDVATKEVLGKEFSKKATNAQDMVSAYAGESYNLSSSQAKQRLLYGLLALPFQYHPKTKKVTTDKDALQKLKKIATGEKRIIVGQVLDYQKYNKLITTYTAMNADVSDRIHCSYTLVSTWRTSSSSSPFGNPGEKQGGNLQNIPVRTEEGKAMRRLFIPDKPKKLGKADYIQAEAQVVAWDAEDLPKIKLFQTGADVHWASAKALFGIPGSIPYNPKALFRDKITGDEHTLKEYREIGKTVEHATNYGMGPRMLQTILAREGFILEFRVCKNLLQRSKSANPFRVEWQRKIREEIKATRTLISPFGRKRQFMGRFNDALFNAAYAFKPQNTVGEMLQVAIQNVWERVPKVDCLINVHDELVFQYLPEDEFEMMRVVKTQMKIPLEIRGRELLIKTQLSSGWNWGDMEEYEL